MTQASYTAWNGESYEWPPPLGWYEASDQQWWPEGYGPPPPAVPKSVVTPTGDLGPEPVVSAESVIQSANKDSIDSANALVNDATAPAHDATIGDVPNPVVPPQSLNRPTSGRQGSMTVRDMSPPGPLAGDDGGLTISSADAPKAGSTGSAGLGGTATGLGFSGDTTDSPAGTAATPASYDDAKGSTLGEAASSVKDALSGGVSSAAETLGSVAGSAKEVLGGGVGSAGDSLSDTAGSVENAASDAAARTEDNVASARESAIGLGVDGMKTQDIPPLSTGPSGLAGPSAPATRPPGLGGSGADQAPAIADPLPDSPSGAAPSPSSPEPAVQRKGYAPTEQMPPPGQTPLPGQAPSRGQTPPPGQTPSGQSAAQSDVAPSGPDSPIGNPASEKPTSPTTRMPPSGQVSPWQVPSDQIPQVGHVAPTEQMPPPGRTPAGSSAVRSDAASSQPDSFTGDASPEELVSPTTPMPPSGQVLSPGQVPLGQIPQAGQNPPPGQTPAVSQVGSPGHFPPPAEEPLSGRTGGQVAPGADGGPSPQQGLAEMVTPPQQAPRNSPESIPAGGGLPQMNAPVSPQPVQSFQGGFGSAQAPNAGGTPGNVVAPSADTAGGFPSKAVGIGIGVFFVVAVLGLFAWMALRDSTTELTTPGSLAQPHPIDLGINIFWPDPPGQKWYIEVIEPAALDAETGIDDTVAARLRITNRQSISSSSSLSQLTFTAVTPDGEVIGEECPFSETALDRNATVEVGAQVEGDVCWVVPGGSIDLLLGVESSEAGGRVHMRLN